MRHVARAASMDVTVDDIDVMFVTAEGGPVGAKAAFDRLEAKLPSLRGRKFYGTYFVGEYRACVARRPGDDPAVYGLPVWVIPGGWYAREKMRNWSRRIPEIARTVMAMAERERQRVDPDRPGIEFYRSQDELILLLPVRRQAGGSSEPA